MSNSLCCKKLSPNREFQVLSNILAFDIPKPAKRFSLNQMGYDNDEKIIELLIRTSLTIEELYSKLEDLGYDNVNKNHIQISESGTVCVPLPTKDFEYIPIYETIMSFNY